VEREVNAAPVLAVSGASKSFFGVPALAGVDLEIRPGEIHALLGENGAGKSTLIKALAGVQAADGGSFVVAGKPLPSAFTPQDVMNAGLRFVHQDFGLIETLSVAENIAFVAGFPKRRGFIDHAAAERAARCHLAALDLAVPPEALVGELEHAEKAIVALSRAMQRGAKLIVLDEVTAALPSPDAARVHRAIRAARAAGVAFLYVSHRLEEVFDLCDRLTVLRDGRVVASAAVADVDSGKVIEWIAGRSVAKGRKTGRAAPRSDAPIRLTGMGLCGGCVAAPTTIEVHAGEIVGITGIIGSGYGQICEWLCGLGAPEQGSMTIDGVRLPPGSTAKARDAGCEAVLGDRSRAAFPERRVRENLFADRIARKNGRVDLAEEAKRTESAIKTYGVRPADAREMAMQSLSGGNQQKVLFARALTQKPKALVLIDPTAGVDIGARGDLHDMLRRSAAEGAAIVMGSSDFEEIAATCDRVLVIREGAIGAELAGEEIRWDRLFAEAHGGRRSHGRPELGDGAKAGGVLS
jgi:ribose transport system ATP-binding protein